MNELAQFFWYIFVVFTVISLLLCVEAHFHYRNKRGIDDDQDFRGHYRYFGQSIRNRHRQIIGYELLLREYDPATKKWRLPKQVDYFPLSRVVHTVQQVEPDLPTTIRTLALNMTKDQLLDFRAERFFNWILGIVNQHVMIELNANDLITSNWLERIRLLRRLRRIDRRKIKVVVENVDSSNRMFKALRPYLGETDYLKFEASAFNKSATHWIDVTLNQWKQQLQFYKVEPVLGRVESDDQQHLADQLGIPFRQGYLYDRPKLI